MYGNRVDVREGEARGVTLKGKPRQTLFLRPETLTLQFNIGTQNYMEYSKL
jgi:hypothetical protein